MNAKVRSPKIDLYDVLRSNLSSLATGQRTLFSRRPPDQKVNVIKNTTFTYLLH